MGLILGQSNHNITSFPLPLSFCSAWKLLPGSSLRGASATVPSSLGVDGVWTLPRVRCCVAPAIVGYAWLCLKWSRKVGVVLDGKKRL